MREVQMLALITFSFKVEFKQKFCKKLLYKHIFIPPCIFLYICSIRCCCPVFATGKLCQDLVLFCDKNPCENGGQCVNKDYTEENGGYECSCKTGDILLKLINYILLIYWN